MQKDRDNAFSPFTLNGLTLKNRFIKTATFEGMSKDGIPTPDLFRFHREIAEGGVAMTTVAYGAVNEDGLTNEDQMVINENAMPYLEKLAKEVHDAGGAISLQLTHCGFFTRSTRYKSRRPQAPSRILNKYGIMKGRSFSKAMNQDDLDRTRADFGKAAQLAKTCGFDAVEVHLGHGYLLSQFLTPIFNKRKDHYGGNLENRLRYPLEVVREVRKNVGESFPIICKMNLCDGFEGGLTEEEAIKVAKALEKEGMDALLLSGGVTSRTPFYLMRGEVPLKEMVRAEKNILQKLALFLFGKQIIRKYDFEPNFFLEQAKKVRAEVEIPLIYVGGVISGWYIGRIMASGFDLIALGRALIHDPRFLEKVKEAGLYKSECNQCNVCVAEMDRSGVQCVLQEK
ncbi:MAG: NADH:flavin oxidoreductase [Bacteroidetes bacterium]|nr:NADH:flavin oxidoreductase [Bacteroidota bacterium]